MAIKDRPREATQGTATEHTNQGSADENSVTRLPDAQYGVRVRAIALMPVDRRMGATTSLAKDFNLNIRVVASAVEVEALAIQGPLPDYRPEGLPTHVKRFAIGTEDALRHSAKVSHWLVISEYAPNPPEPLWEGVSRLWLPAFHEPSDFQWPVHGLPVTCILGESDMLRLQKLARVLLEAGATEVTCRTTDDSGTVHINPYVMKGAA